MKKIIALLVSIFCISICLVSSITIWNNRSLYFKDFIYSDINLKMSLEEYCADINNFLQNKMTKDDFIYRSINIYFYITDEATGDIFTNLSEEISYEKALADADMLKYKYRDPNLLNQFTFGEYSVVERLDTDIIYPGDGDSGEPGYSGYIFIFPLL